MHSNLRYGTKIVKKKKKIKLAGIGIGSFIEDGRILGTQVKSATTGHTQRLKRERGREGGKP